MPGPLSDIAASINSVLEGRVAVPGFDDLLCDVKERVPSGSWALDLLLGGGWPVGRVIEVRGQPSVGKTTLCIHAMIEAQKIGGSSLLLDYETSFDKGRAALMGWQEDRHLQLEARTLENGFKSLMVAVREIRKTNDYPGPICGVWDTMDVAPTIAQLESGDVMAGGAAERARRQIEGMRMLSMFLAEHRVVLFVVKHIIASIQINRFQKREDASLSSGASGGGAVPYQASIIIDVGHKGNFNDADGNDVGLMASVYIKKSKVCLPHRGIKLVVYHGMGIDDGETMLNFLVDKGIIVQSGGWYKVPGYERGLRWEELRTMSSTDEAFKTFLSDSVTKLLA